VPDADRRQPIRIACEGADTLSLDRLTPLQGDLKRLSPANATRLRKEILDLGFSEPISVWQTNGTTYILNGHQRVTVLKAMQADGYTIPPLPVSRVDATNLEQARRKILALTSQYGEMTPDGLSDFLAETELTLPEVDASFRFPEIDMAALKPEPEIVEDEAPEVQPDPITAPGEIVELGRHRVMCGDAASDDVPIDGPCSNLVTDPPFNIGFDYGIGFADQQPPDKYGAWLWAIIEKHELQLHGPWTVFVWQAMLMCRHWPEWFPRDYRIFASARGFTQYMPTPVQFSWDPVIFWRSPESNVTPQAGRRDYFLAGPEWAKQNGAVAHPCPRTVAACSYIMGELCEAGGVIDPFLGSGTTLIAAEQLGRTCYGMEIEPRYCDVAVRRYYNLVGWEKAPAEHRERWEPA